MAKASKKAAPKKAAAKKSTPAKAATRKTATPKKSAAVASENPDNQTKRLAGTRREFNNAEDIKEEKVGRRVKGTEKEDTHVTGQKEKVSDPTFVDDIEEGYQNQGVNVQGDENPYPTAGEKVDEKTLTPAVSEDSLRAGAYGAPKEDGRGGFNNQSIHPEDRDEETSNSF